MWSHILRRPGGVSGENWCVKLSVIARRPSTNRKGAGVTVPSGKLPGSVRSWSDEQVHRTAPGRVPCGAPVVASKILGWGEDQFILILVEKQI